jgi:FKBP-type peptidyl-prolyl cis-trans isomerase FkpA
MKRALRWMLVSLMPLLAACDSSEDAGQCNEPFDIDDVVVGNGAEAEVGKLAVLHYEGFLCDAEASDMRGTKFDSSVDRGTPFSFVPGTGTVIEGWEQGIPGMKVGGRRILTIPPELAYGSQGSGEVIPPNATLIFEVELLDVQ